MPMHSFIRRPKRRTRRARLGLERLERRLTPAGPGNQGPVQLDVGGDAFANEDQLFVRQGTVTDSGEATVSSVQVFFGDETVAGGEELAPTTVAVNPDGTFTLAHTYAEEGSYVVTVTASDNAGFFDYKTFSVDVMLAGVPLDTADKEFVAPGQTATVDAQLGSSLVTVTYTHSREASFDAAIIVAVVPNEVAAGLTGSLVTQDGRQVSAAYDVRALGVYPFDVAVVTFHYSGDGTPTLTYYDKLTRRQEEVGSDTYVVDEQNDTITVVLDRDSTPQLRDLTGTVFTISVPFEAPDITPPVSAPVVPVAANPPSFPNANSDGPSFALFLQGPSSESAVVVLARSSGPEAESITTGGREGATRASVFVVASLGINGGGAAGDAAAAAPEHGPLKDLPRVHGTVTDLPGVNLTPPSTDLTTPATSSKSETPKGPGVTEEISVPPVEDFDLEVHAAPPEDTPACEGVSDAVFCGYTALAESEPESVLSPSASDALFLAALTAVVLPDPTSRSRRRPSFVESCLS